MSVFYVNFVLFSSIINKIFGFIVKKKTYYNKHFFAALQITTAITETLHKYYIIKPIWLDVLAVNLWYVSLKRYNTNCVLYTLRHSDSYNHPL